jgi:acetyl esterase/lipase/lysophospholipase L1-like esterase
MNKKLLFLLLLIASASVNAQQKVIQLYNGAAPGSEKWTWNETEDSLNMYHAHTIYNVSHPTLTVYLPDSTYTPTGTAVIVCPGGGLQSLSIMQEGYQAVKWFQEHGITAFLLKYRLVHTLGTDPYKQENDRRGKPEFDKERNMIAGMAITDAQTAIAYVRAHAEEYHISPSRVGIIGFSAGGLLAVATAVNYTPENKPDFSIPVYGGFPEAMLKNIPADAPPMFIAAATNDSFGLESESVALYNAWITAGHSAELHIYSKGSHGFGMRTQGLVTDTWTDRLADWLDQQGFITPAYPRKGKSSAKQAADFTKFMDYLLHNDWAVISHFQDRNDSIKAHLNPAEKRVVFMGNSITEGWKNIDPGYFAGRPYINSGISGQTTPQMLVRFREDVIDLKPAVVVILAGINDIAQNTGPIPVEDTFGNIQSMAQLAHASHIKVVLSSVMPAATISWRPSIYPVQKIIDLNKMIKAYAAQMGFGYIDYYDAMVVGDNKALNPQYTHEGLHPNLAGYKVMEPLAEKAISDALNNKTN